MRKLIKEKADASVIGRTAALLHVDCLARICALMDQFDLMLGFQLFAPNLTLEENLPRANTSLRLLGDLNKMMLEQMDGLMKCYGGPAAIGIQMLAEWAKGDKERQEFLRISLLAAADRANRSRGRK